MSVQRLLLTFALICTFYVALSVQQVRIGTTHIYSGPLIGWGMLHNNVWTLFQEKNLTYTISGSNHPVQVISYLDDNSLSDGATTVALVERLILVDKVHMLMTSYSGNTYKYFIPTAEKYGIPCINVGAFDYAFAPPGTFYWTLSVMPSVKNLGSMCAAPLFEAGARNFSVVRTELDPSRDSSIAGLIRTLSAGGLNYTGTLLNISISDWNDQNELAELDPVIEELKKEDADLVVFDFRQAGNIGFIDRMRRNNYNPRAYYVWSTGSYPDVRGNLTWKDAGSLISEAYSPFLNASDPLWIGTAAYDKTYRARFNLSTAFADATLAAGLSVLDEALKNTVDLSPAAIRNALLAVSISTVVGTLSFTNGTVNRDLYCLQNSFPNATEINTVWPKEAVSYQKLVYPAVISYPPRYFDQFHPKPDHRIRNILIGIFCSFAFLLLVAGIILLIFNAKYHAIFIKKEESHGVDEAF